MEKKKKVRTFSPQIGTSGLTLLLGEQVASSPPDASSKSTSDDLPPLPTPTPPKLLLAQSYKLDGSGPDPTGYWMSEKVCLPSVSSRRGSLPLRS